MWTQNTTWPIYAIRVLHIALTGFLNARENVLAQSPESIFMRASEVDNMQRPAVQIIKRKRKISSAREKKWSISLALSLFWRGSVPRKENSPAWFWVILMTGDAVITVIRLGWRMINLQNTFLSSPQNRNSGNTRPHETQALQPAKISIFYKWLPCMLTWHEGALRAKN